MFHSFYGLTLEEDKIRTKSDMLDKIIERHPWLIGLCSVVVLTEVGVKWLSK